ncbi:MAG TPA: NERD domain-containing protein [Candidatus Tetragenococcus pullicola]|nr:NERD domain-containing protein [Candidatus Tetragenococcus pullicola]
MRKKNPEYQYLETLSKRLTLFEKEKKKLERLQKGYAAECSLDRLQEFLTKDKLPCIDDLYLKTNESCVQIDKLIVVENTAYVIDVKNYSGKYTFVNNEWIRDNLPLQENIFEQLHNAMRAVKRVLLKAGSDLEVKGVLVFMNATATIDIKDSVADLVLDIREVGGWFIEQMSKISDQQDNSWQEIINRQKIEPISSKEVFSPKRIDYLQKGILCRNCNKEQKRTTYAFKCPHCQGSEPKETAYVRSICEYGVIFCDKELLFKDLLIFLGSDVSKRYLREILTKHFGPKITHGVHVSYRNKVLIFDYWFANKMDYFQSLEVRTHWKPKKESDESTFFDEKAH